MSIRWEEVRLGDICSIQMCKRIFKDETTQEGEIPFYKIGTIGDKADAYISKELFLEYKNKFNYPKKGEVLITCSGTVGKCIVFDGHDSYYQDSNIVWLRLKDNIMDNSFLYYFLSNHKWDNLGQTTIKRIYSDDLKNITIKLPPLKEQEKIAEILSSCDEHIKNLKNLKSELEKEKLHLMNELLSGKTRFANFTTPWQEVKFGDILTFASCNSKSKFICDDGKYFIVDMGSVTQDGVLNTSKRTNLEEDFLKIDDLVMPKDDIGKGLIIGKVAIIKEDNKYICGDHIYKINTTENPNFIRFLINSCEVNKEIKRVVKGTAQLGLSKKDIEKIKIKLPSLEEQKKIGEVLSACDERLECLNELITAQTTLKSHLLTELLSGNIRVKV